VLITIGQSDLLTIGIVTAIIIAILLQKGTWVFASKIYLENIEAEGLDLASF
jgi:hypothetical protein